MGNEIRKGAELELEVEKLALGGKALAHIDGLVVFLSGGLPGQRVRARIVRKKKQFAEGRVLEALSRAPHEQEPFCRHFGTCGGCRWQDLAYEEQLKWKRLHVLECLRHLAGIHEASVEPTVPSPTPLHYRNKMEYTFSPRRWLSTEEVESKDTAYDRSFALGLHVRGFFDRVFNVEECFLQSPRSVEILRSARRWTRNSGFPAYGTRDHQGFWRFFVVREGKHTGEVLIHFITAPHPRQDEAARGLARHLMEAFPDIATIVHSVSGKKAQVAQGEASRVLEGPGVIEERLGSLRFRISAHSFFQTNPYGAEKLYETVLRLGEFTGKEEVWDLYAGTGSIALFIASKVRGVTGFEVVGDAVEDAYRNCELNGIRNCRFRAGDLKDVLGSAEGAPDVVVTDPPRAGMHPKVVKALLERRPGKIICVSCNPATLARDLELLSEHYSIGKIRPFDLFPHTPHIECVVDLRKK